MEYTIVPDTSIVTVHYSGPSNIVYRDNAGELHAIDFEVCAGNFHTEHKNSSGRCIGERNSADACFILYTSGIKTRIEFKRLFDYSSFLKGTRSARFRALQKLIIEAQYTTFDLS